MEISDFGEEHAWNFSFDRGHGCSLLKVYVKEEIHDFIII